LEEFLTRHPTGKTADRARAKLEKLRAKK